MTNTFWHRKTKSNRIWHILCSIFGWRLKSPDYMELLPLTTWHFFPDYMELLPLTTWNFSSDYVLCSIFGWRVCRIRPNISQVCRPVITWSGYFSIICSRAKKSWIHRRNIRHNNLQTSIYFIHSLGQQNIDKIEAVHAEQIMGGKVLTPPWSRN